MSKLKIAVIIASIRDNRFGDKPAKWIADLANERPEIAAEIVDLKDYPLPLFNAPASDSWMPATDPAAIKWQNKLAEFDGYVFVTAEYNRSIPGAFKNAIDHAYQAWNRKAAAYVGYGSVGGARAVEHLREISIELQLAPVRSGVHIGGSEFVPIMMGQKTFDDVKAVVEPSAKDMLDQLIWWTAALKIARQNDELNQVAA